MMEVEKRPGETKTAKSETDLDTEPRVICFFIKQACP